VPLCVPRIWYNLCLLTLLRPFVTGSASLVDGLPASLSGDTTPQTVCRQASEAIITLTTAYQAHYSLNTLPPLLPYMVFAAVLHQLSLATPTQAQMMESPRSISPGSISGPYSVPGRRPSVVQAGTHLAVTMATAGNPKFSSPALATQAPRSARRENSALSTSSACFSNDAQARRGSICSFTSSATSNVDNSPSPESTDTKSDTLPTFTSQPTDLVTVGFLQLVAMGSQHHGAAEAANLLRTVRSDRETTRFHLLPGKELGDLVAQSSLPAVLGLQIPPEHLSGYQVTSSDTVPGPASVPRSGLGVPLHMTGPPPESSSTGPGRQPSPQLVEKSAKESTVV
jgi:hypothetical protein